MDLRRREVEVRLLVQPQSDGQTIVDRHVYVSPYDFPMLDNTRLPNGERCSVVLTDFFVDVQASDKDKQLNSFANLDVVVFPATSPASRNASSTTSFCATCRATRIDILTSVPRRGQLSVLVGEACYNLRSALEDLAHSSVGTRHLIITTFTASFTTRHDTMA